MANSNDGGFLRGDSVGGLYGPLVVDANVTGGSSDTLLGALTETAPATDTASSGLNGRLQRIAQRLSTLISRQDSSTATHTNVNDTASSTTLLASNAARKGASIYNDSTSDLYIKLGATASATSFTYKAVAAAYYEVPFGYTGVIDGIWSADASGAARVVEFT